MRLQRCHLVLDNKIIWFPLLFKHNPDIWGGLKSNCGFGEASWLDNWCWCFQKLKKWMKTRRDKLQSTFQHGYLCHGLRTSGTRHPGLEPFGSVGFLLHPLLLDWTGIRRVEVRVKAIHWQAPSAVHGWNLWFWRAPSSSGVAIKAAFFVLMF